MKSAILLLLCLSSTASVEEAQRFAATLPNGVRVELVGVSFHSLGKRSEPSQWWRPDGAMLTQEPYRSPHQYTTCNYDEYGCEFALRIHGPNDYSCAAFHSLGQSNVTPGIPGDAGKQPLPELRSFVCNFKKTLLSDTIRVGICTAPWQRVDQWSEEWQKSEPEEITVDSDKALVFTWPRKDKRGAVVVEITHRYVDEATHLLMYDREGNVRAGQGSRHGQGQGIEKRIYWHWNVALEDIDRFEFEKRSYQWVEFRNVSLQPGRKTDVEVVALGERAALGTEEPQTSTTQKNLGLLLDRLAANLAFPTSGQARYQIRETSAFLPAPRLLTCNYAFSGSRYAFELAETGSSFHFKSYFDGDRSVRWTMLGDVATVWQGRREQRPIYRLDRFWPADVVEDLLGHDVEFPGAGALDGVPCSLIVSTLSSKDKLKVWVSEEPAVFPVRIERYEHDHLRYLYEARTITMRNGVPFPEQIKEASYRWDDATGLAPTSGFDVTIESFEPNAHIAPGAFTPQFSSETTVSRHQPVEAEVSAFEPTTPVRCIQSFDGIAVPFDLKQARGKMLLVCFFDMNQRPARRCVVQLAEEAKDLEEEGVQVVAVQAPDVDEDELAAWAARQKIPFPVGRIEGDIEKVKSAWGVQSLPWLILTDTEHIVRAEGFALNELDHEIVELGD
ncbi:MAG: redoxin domain-containing protein [Sedimentisphaerales bacterium]|nr:redoxin domain-containing protein [Sedimentisphaerales bacterium]